MDKKSKKYILKWQIAGAFFLIIVGSLLHFAYAWSGYNPFVGMVSAVNESVWEHLKLGYWALVLFILIEYWFIRKKAHNFCLANALGILALEIFIIVFFYAYTLFLPEMLALDILSYVIGCILCQYIIYKLLTARKMDPIWNIAGALLLAGIAAALMILTFYPPHWSMFQEEHSGNYGTTWDYQEENGHDH